MHFDKVKGMKGFGLITLTMRNDPIPSSFEGVEKGLPVFLELFRRYSIRTTVFAKARTAQRYPEILDEIINRGNEVGCCGYRDDMLEIYGKGVFHSPDIPTLKPHAKRSYLKSAKSLLERLISHKVESFSAPELAMDTETLSILDRLGFSVDSSFCSPTYGNRVPYHPSKRDWQSTFDREGMFNILEVPITAGFHVSKRERVGFYDYTFEQLHSVPFRLDKMDDLIKICDQVQTCWQDYGFPPIFVLLLHSWDVVKSLSWKNKFPLWAKGAEHGEEKLEKLLTIIDERYNVRYLTMSEFRRIWETKYCPHHSCAR